MPSTPIRDSAHGYLQESRAVVLNCIEGLDERRLRLPMTRTGTNLLGVVKHLVGIEAGYLGLCLGHRFSEPLDWIEDELAGPVRDMWATPDESRASIVGLYRRACEHSDSVLAEVGDEAPAVVPWWPAETQRTKASSVVARVLKDTAMHAGQMQILRELLDGRAGHDSADLGNELWWQSHVEHLRDIADGFAAPKDN